MSNKKFCYLAFIGLYFLLYTPAREFQDREVPHWAYQGLKIFADPGGNIFQPVIATWRPVQAIIAGAEFLIWGLNSRGFWAVQVLLHLFLVGLLYLLVKRRMDQKIALMAALLFLFSPAATPAIFNASALGAGMLQIFFIFSLLLLQPNEKIQAILLFLVLSILSIGSGELAIGLVPGILMLGAFLLCRSKTPWPALARLLPISIASAGTLLFLRGGQFNRTDLIGQISTATFIHVPEKLGQMLFYLFCPFAGVSAVLDHQLGMTMLALLFGAAIMLAWRKRLDSLTFALLSLLLAVAPAAFFAATQPGRYDPRWGYHMYAGVPFMAIIVASAIDSLTRYIHKNAGLLLLGMLLILYAPEIVKKQLDAMATEDQPLQNRLDAALAVELQQYCPSLERGDWLILVNFPELKRYLLLRNRYSFTALLCKPGIFSRFVRANNGTLKWSAPMLAEDHEFKEEIPEKGGKRIVIVGVVAGTLVSRFVETAGGLPLNANVDSMVLAFLAGLPPPD